VLEDALDASISNLGLSQASQPLSIAPGPPLQDTHVSCTVDPVLSEADGLNDIGLFDWVDQIDWTGATGEWGAF
jgi:hypothetical protein